MLKSRNSSQIDENFTRGRHEKRNDCYIRQSFLGLPRQSIRINSDILILFTQTIRNVQTVYYDIGAHDMLYSEIEE